MLRLVALTFGMVTLLVGAPMAWAAVPWAGGVVAPSNVAPAPGAQIAAQYSQEWFQTGATATFVVSAALPGWSASGFNTGQACYTASYCLGIQIAASPTVDGTGRPAPIAGAPGVVDFSPSGAFQFSATTMGDQPLPPGRYYWRSYAKAACWNVFEAGSATCAGLSQRFTAHPLNKAWLPPLTMPTGDAMCPWYDGLSCMAYSDFSSFTVGEQGSSASTSSLPDSAAASTQMGVSQARSNAADAATLILGSTPRALSIGACTRRSPSSFVCQAAFASTRARYVGTLRLWNAVQGADVWWRGSFTGRVTDLACVRRHRRRCTRAVTL